MTPDFIYGTAWKEERTAALATQALNAGFRCFDTANQRKHYVEAGLGEALQPWLQQGRREELWIQTKFTFQRGQDHRLPYDPAAPVGEQVRQSAASSLKHLGTHVLDSLVLHGPSTDGWVAADREAWRALEGLLRDGVTRSIGVSNVTASQLEQVVAFTDEPIQWVQNRCYARRGWDADVRAICRANGIRYQGFSLLTANRVTWAHPTVQQAAEELNRTPAQVLFGTALAQGQVPLTGTSSPEHAAEARRTVELPPIPAEWVDRITRLESS